jgi:uncharacterized OsmC-like protein/TusA-related sulfurtransferase
MAEETLHAPADIQPHEVCDGGNLDCGSGLLLLIRKAMQQVPAGGVLEIRSTEISVREDLPAWCRMTQNPYLGWQKAPTHNKYFVRRGGSAPAEATAEQQARDYRWQCRVRWSGGLQCRVYARNHSWEVGQPASFDVQDAAPSAVEYVLGALGACLAMGFQMHASRRGIQVEALEISLSGQIDNIFVFLGLEQDGHSGFRAISGTLYVRADTDEDTLQALWQHTLTASPLANTLVRPVALDIAVHCVP